MRTRIVKIGNSQGIRIPKPLLEQTGLEGEVEIEVRERSLVILRADGPRNGWDEAFQVMAVQGDDRLLVDASLTSRWDEEEWEWQQ